jgi:transposase
MEKFDGRKIGTEEMEQIRIRVVKRVQQGESPEKIIAIFGFSRASVYNWLARYRSGGWDALFSGEHTGRPKKLDDTQIAWISETIHDKNPLQFKFPFALWMRGMVTRLIHRQFGIKLSVSTEGRLLRQMGFSCQKPSFRTNWKDPEAVEHWKKTEFPYVKKRAKKLGATIYFEEEYRIKHLYWTPNIWRPIKDTPQKIFRKKRLGKYVIAAVSTRGHMRFMVNQGIITEDVLCDFLKRLMHNSQQPIFLIWDGRTKHKSKKVRECIKSFEGKLEVYFLP